MKDYFNYDGKVCVVTGSSNGMGLATTKMLVDLGAKVYAVSRSETKVEGLAACVLCDLTKKAEVDKAFAQLPDHIDCFFGVAGLSGAKTDYVTTFNCDFTANKYITLEYLVNRMSAGGSITYVASTAGLNWREHQKEQNAVVHAEGWEGTEKALGKLPEISPSNFAYIYAKRCICQFAAEQAVELGKRGIRVNTVMPGSTQSGIAPHYSDKAMKIGFQLAELYNENLAEKVERVCIIKNAMIAGLYPDAEPLDPAEVLAYLQECGQLPAEFAKFSTSLALLGSFIQGFSFENIDKFSTASLVTRLTTDIGYVRMAFMMPAGGINSAEISI